ncbi:A/G-specific adenine glycosylase [Sphingobacterium kyonggiense]
MSFSARILAWYQTNKRALPWRETTNPYIIWLSEIILQQTRVEQGLPYFLRFVENFPNVTKFAEADEADLLRLWQGLGYYSRARNMHKAAKLVVDQHNGEFPIDYSSLINLPGVGAYTAAAIASFSSNEAKAVLDGNVFRVLARYFGIAEPINSTAGKKLFSELAEELIDPLRAGEYNQAIMDFGALQCKPKNPDCSVCIFQTDCVALQQDLVSELPKKNKSKKSRVRHFHYFLIEDSDGWLMSQRSEGDIWANLFEFPMIETVSAVDPEELMESAEFKESFSAVFPQKVKGPVKHILSHQQIFANFYRLDANKVKLAKKSHWNYCLSENLDKLAKHKLISSFVEDYIFSAH